VKLVSFIVELLISGFMVLDFVFCAFSSSLGCIYIGFVLIVDTSVVVDIIASMPVENYIVLLVHNVAQVL